MQKWLLRKSTQTSPVCTCERWYFKGSAGSTKTILAKFYQPGYPWNSRGSPLLNHHLGAPKLVWGRDFIWPGPLGAILVAGDISSESDPYKLDPEPDRHKWTFLGTYFQWPTNKWVTEVISWTFHPTYRGPAHLITAFMTGLVGPTKNTWSSIGFGWKKGLERSHVYPSRYANFLQKYPCPKDPFKYVLRKGTFLILRMGLEPSILGRGLDS